MSNKRIKDDTTYIRDLEGLLKDKLRGKILKQDVAPLTQFGENFGSEMLRVEVTVEEDGKQKVIYAVGKLIPPTEFQLELFNTQVTFKNEIGFYAEIVPTLQEFQREHGVLPVLEYFPEFYGGRTSLNQNGDTVDTDAVILMENLAISGYHNQDRLKGMDLYSAKTVLRALAQFQATALALRKNKPEVFESKVSPYLAERSVARPPFNFDSVLAENPNTVALTKKVQNLCSKSFPRKIREPWASIVHQDFWVNNIMVTEANGNIESLKFVDFQMTDLGSPLTDVIFFLFSSVQVQVLQFHFERLLNYYYTQFVQVLQDFRVDTREFTYESFLDEAKAVGAYQSFHALFMISIILRPKAEKPTPGKTQDMNPFATSNGNSGRLSNGHNNELGSPKPPFLPEVNYTLNMKQKIWFIVEEAAKRNWI